jgi:hypothetical protein
VTFTGTLGDGTTITHSAALSKSGEFPLGIPMYGGKGLLLGWVPFYTNDVMFTNLTWIRPPIVGSKYYPAGFAGLKDFHGSKYTRPAAGQNILGWTNGLVVIGGGNLTPAQTISNRVRVVNNVVSVLDGNSRRIKMSISVTNGTFKGTFKHPVTRTTNAFSGALLQLPHWGGGWFKGKNQTGFISLEPVPPAVSITSPTNEAFVEACVSVTLSADASLNSGGAITRVEFFANGVSVGSDDTAPYESSFTPAANGSYTLTAIATDNLGSQTTSAAVTVHVLNHAPSFSSGGEVTVTENSGAYSGPWASNIDDGESCYDQGLSFMLSNDNPGLFSIQPTIDTAGVLSFALMDNTSGIANVTVTLKDDGGTAGGGIDSSSASLRIVVNP